MILEISSSAGIKSKITTEGSQPIKINS